MRRYKERMPEVFGAWERLVNGRKAECLPRSRTLYTPEQQATELFLLSEGQVGLYLLGPDKRTLMLHVVEPGNLFGHVAAVRDGQYDTFAETISTAHVYRIDQSALTQMIADDAEFALSLLEDLGRQRLNVSHRLDELTFKSVPARLASLLLDMARANADQQEARVPRWSHRQLAEMINAYRETVTKVINQFRAARLLEIDRSTITLTNRSGLEELAQGY